MTVAAKLWRALPLRGPGRLVVADLHRRTRRSDVTAVGPLGVRFHVDPANPPELSIYLWGTYEPEVVAAMGCLLRAGGTAVDIGANCGVLTVLMRQMVGPDGKVMAVEPSPAGCDRIREQAAFSAMHDIAVYNLALGDAAGNEVFRRGRIGIGMLPLVDADLTTGGSARVNVSTMDEISADLDASRIDLIKIDTDGSEVSILRGAAAVLRRDRPALIFETYIEGLRRRDVTPAALAEILDTHDYELFVPTFGRARRWSASPPQPRGFVGARISDLADGLLDECNVVAISRGSDMSTALRRFPPVM